MCGGLQGWRLQPCVQWPWAVVHLLSLEAARLLCSSCCSDGHTYYAYTCYAYTCYAYTCYAYTCYAYN